jgi:hypothetical protein
MKVKNALAGIAVRDLPAAIEWYANVLDRLPDSRPMDKLAEWQFSSGGWIQVFQDESRAGFSSVTFVEDDLESRLQHFRRKGIEVGPTSSSELVKIAILNDPDGNRVVFAQGIDFGHRSTS